METTPQHFTAEVEGQTYRADSLWALYKLIPGGSQHVLVSVQGLYTDLDIHDLSRAKHPLLSNPTTELGFIYKGSPMATRKTTHAGRHSPHQKAYHDYKDAILEAATGAARRAGLDTLEEIIAMHCVFHMPLPARCYGRTGRLNSEGLERVNQPHEVTPDRDNLVKPIQDALARRDEAISVGTESKVWAADRRGAVAVRLVIRPTVLKTPVLGHPGGIGMQVDSPVVTCTGKIPSRVRGSRAK
jgi:Holliday junction resolvase RusA-like endonuclease